MSFQLRRLREGEEDEARALHPSPHPDTEWWAAFAGGRMLGFVAFREGWIDRLHVHPDHRGAGVGSALLTVAKESWGALSAWMPREDAATARFWEERGFQAAGEGGEANVRMMWAEE